jgi:hypothetical protein
MIRFGVGLKTVSILLELVILNYSFQFISDSNLLQKLPKVVIYFLIIDSIFKTIYFEYMVVCKIGLCEIPDIANFGPETIHADIEMPR